MATITEDFCSYEVAKLLKEKGFECEKKSISAMYNELGVFHSLSTANDEYYDYKDFDKYDYNAPTLQMAMKWLREVHKICIVVYPFTHRERGTYTSDICTLTMTMEEGHLRGVWNSYEEAVEATLKYSLENLI